MLNLNQDKCEALVCKHEPTHVVIAYKTFMLCCKDHALQFYILDANEPPPSIIALPPKE